MTTARLDSAAPRFDVQHRPALRSLVVAALCALLAAAFFADLRRGAHQVPPPAPAPTRTISPPVRTS